MSDVKTYPVQKSDEEWRRILTPEQYAVLRGHATERRRIVRAARRTSRRDFCLRGMRAAPLRRRAQVRERHRLAQFLRAAGRRHRLDGRPQLRHDPDRSPLQPVRRPPGPRVRRRPAADRTAVLHQRGGAEFRTCTLMRCRCSPVVLAPVDFALHSLPLVPSATPRRRVVPACRRLVPACGERDTHPCSEVPMVGRHVLLGIVVVSCVGVGAAMAQPPVGSRGADYAEHQRRQVDGAVKRRRAAVFSAASCARVGTATLTVRSMVARIRESRRAHRRHPPRGSNSASGTLPVYGVYVKASLTARGELISVIENLVTIPGASAVQAQVGAEHALGRRATAPLRRRGRSTGTRAA